MIGTNTADRICTPAVPEATVKTLRMNLPDFMFVVKFKYQKMKSIIGNSCRRNFQIVAP